VATLLCNHHLSQNLRRKSMAVGLGTFLVKESIPRVLPDFDQVFAAPPPFLLRAMAAPHRSRDELSYLTRELDVSVHLRSSFIVVTTVVY
jgi:hypothetical protein